MGLIIILFILFGGLLAFGLTRKKASIDRYVWTLFAITCLVLTGSVALGGILDRKTEENLFANDYKYYDYAINTLYDADIEIATRVYYGTLEINKIIEKHKKYSRNNMIGMFYSRNIANYEKIEIPELLVYYEGQCYGEDPD